MAHAYRLFDWYDNRDRKHFSLVKGIGKNQQIVHTWLAKDPVGQCNRPDCGWTSQFDLPPHHQFEDYVRHMYQIHRKKVKT